MPSLQSGVAVTPATVRQPEVEPMRGITVRQPWAWLIAEGLKPVENRDHPAIIGQARKLVGQRIAIHAGVKGADAWTVAAAIRDVTVEQATEIADQCGHIIATARVVGIIERGEVHPLNAHPLRTNDRFALVLDDVRKLPTPIEAKGKLGLWPLTPEQERAVREQENT